MRRNGTPIQTLLLRTFLPAVVVAAMLLATLVYNWLYASIIDGFDRKLVATSALTGAMIDAGDHDALMRATVAKAEPEALEKTSEYRRNAEPMQRILTSLDLTYLYSQAFGGEQDIYYILDGTQGEEHTLPGSEDDLTDETRVGLTQTEKNGSIYVSPIEYQEQWGLLKTAAAPIYGADGRITSTAGADVNISVIQVATQNALFASALIGIGSILACVAVALVIVRRVAGPIAALKQEALRIAAGDETLPAEVRSPREVAQLRDALAQLTVSMSAASAQSREAAAQHEQEANEALAAGSGMPPPPVTLVDGGAIRVIWIAEAKSGIEADLAARAMAQLAARISLDPALAENWRELADFGHGVCLVVDHASGSIILAGREPVNILLNGKDIRLEPGLPVELSRHDPASAIVFGHEIALMRSTQP